MCALNDKVVIVTGGGSGIGRAVALNLADRGAKVVITGRRAVPLEETAGQQPNIVGVVADAATPDDSVRTIAKAVDTWGHLDVLVNNAGAGVILPLAEATADRRTYIVAVNVLGPSLLASAALPLPDGESRRNHQRLEIAPHGVHVNAVAAGPTESDALTRMLGLHRTRPRPLRLAMAAVPLLRLSSRVRAQHTMEATRGLSGVPPWWTRGRARRVRGRTP